MAKVEETDCRERHEEERTMYFEAMGKIKSTALPRWVFLAVLVALLGIATSVAGILYSGILEAKAEAAEAKDEAGNNETALARVDERTKTLQREQRTGFEDIKAAIANLKE